jgi:cytosine/adenosine deaminase-related metal-dependent hydrolase
MSETRTFTARWVFPVCGTPLARGTVSVRGDRIEAVLPHGERTPDEDFGNAAIIPGLVNPHTHLDLSGARNQIPPTAPEHFTDWLRGVIAFRRARTAEQTHADIHAGLAECLRYGTTLIGDIAAEGTSWDTLTDAQVRAVVFREVIGLTQTGIERWQEAVQWANTRDPRVAGFSPHAPYSVNAAVIMKSVECLRPVAIHLAESPAEMELLQHRRGPFVEFLQQLGLWENAVLAESPEWILKWTAHAGTKRPVLYAHCNYLPANTEFGAHTSVVYCPRTHAAFGHSRHPFREFAARGVRVCLGTDSLASNPDLDILAEARFVHAREPDLRGEELLRMVTLAGAEALGYAHECGSLEANKSADFVVVPLPNEDANDPHDLLFVDTPGERRTLFRGQWR